MMKKSAVVLSALALTTTLFAGAAQAQTNSATEVQPKAAASTQSVVTPFYTAWCNVYNTSGGTYYEIHDLQNPWNTNYYKAAIWSLENISDGSTTGPRTALKIVYAPASGSATDVYASGALRTDIVGKTVYAYMQAKNGAYYKAGSCVVQ
jgi:hypothetical protein